MSKPTVKVSKEMVNPEDAISGAQMAEYFRKIAVAIETSEKLFIAKLRLTVIGD